MARVQTLKEKVAAIIRQYKYVNPRRFLYNNKRELKGRFNSIRLWLLIHDEDRGYSIFSFTMRRKTLMSVSEWESFWKTPAEGYSSSLYDSITQGILPAINNKGGTNWRYISLLAWTREDAIHKRKNSGSSNTRNTTTKKRNANARSLARRRQRNKTR